MKTITAPVASDVVSDLLDAVRVSADAALLLRLALGAPLAVALSCVFSRLVERPFLARR